MGKRKFSLLCYLPITAMGKRKFSLLCYLPITAMGKRKSILPYYVPIAGEGEKKSILPYYLPITGEGARKGFMHSPWESEMQIRMTRIWIQVTASISKDIYSNTKNAYFLCTKPINKVGSVVRMTLNKIIFIIFYRCTSEILPYIPQRFGHSKVPQLSRDT